MEELGDYELQEIHREQEQREDEQETSFIEPTDDILFEAIDKYEDEPFFDEDGFTEILETKTLFKDVTIFESSVYENTNFIRYLIDTKNFTTRKTLLNGERTDYEFSYIGKPYVNENGVTVIPARNFQTIDGEITDPTEMNTIINDMRYHYDNWKETDMKRTMKRAGIATGIGLFIVALVTGLSVGLTRKGSDIVRSATQIEKIGPSHKRESTPWTEIEKATGKGIMFIGEYLELIIVGGVVYYTVNK